MEVLVGKGVKLGIKGKLFTFCYSVGAGGISGFTAKPFAEVSAVGKSHGVGNFLDGLICMKK